MMYIIENPTAGNGKAAAAVDSACRLLRERGIEYRRFLTEYNGHAQLLARQAASEGADIVCAGGDGSIFDIVNGLAGQPASLYFIPCGTGNDYVRTLKLAREPVEAFRSQLDGAAQSIDVGKVNELYFANVSGCGFDVEVLRQAVRFKRLGTGLLPYLCGVIAALRLFRPLELELTINGVTEKRQATIVSVGNGQYFGGGMKAVPHADPSDGLFDVIVVDKVSRLDILRLLSRFINGAHTSLPFAHETRCTALTIRSAGMTVNLDGELRPMDTAEYSIIPGALVVHLPHSAR